MCLFWLNLNKKKKKHKKTNKKRLGKDREELIETLKSLHYFGGGEGEGEVVGGKESERDAARIKIQMNFSNLLALSGPTSVLVDSHKNVFFLFIYFSTILNA